MLEWITQYINYVDMHPDNFCRNIKNNTRQIKELLSRKNVYYKEADPIAFDKVCVLFKHYEDRALAGQPFKLNLEEKYMAACLLGIKLRDKTTGKYIRYFKEANIFVARKWGKDFFIAPLLTYLVAFDKEPHAWCQILAENKKQATRAFDIIKYEIKEEPLNRLLKYHGSDHNITCEATNGKIEFMSGRVKGKDGSNPSCALIDEAHEITRASQYTSMKTAMGTRFQPMTIVISSAGITPESLYESLRSRDIKFLNQNKLMKNDRIFAMIYELDDNDDVENEKNWIKANPAMYEGRPTLQFLREQFKSMKSDQKTYRQFLAKNLNKQLGAAMDYYDILEIKGCGTNITKKDIYDTYAVGGVDLAETVDFCNATAMIMSEDGKLRILQAYFMAETRLAKASKADHEDFGRMENTNTENIITSQVLIITPGDYVSNEYVTRWFVSLRDEYSVTFLKIGYDPWMSKQWLTNMRENGFSLEEHKTDSETHQTERDQGVLSPVRQGSYTLSYAIKMVKVLFENRQLLYDKNNELLLFCFYNLKIKTDSNNNMSPHKSKSTGHIDGTIGIFNAIIAYFRSKELYAENLIDNFKI